MEKTTCQICERVIKAPIGNAKMGTGGEYDTYVGTPTIAHHGYQRPWGEGWQSASCFGARFRPYELACDALPLAIESLTRYVEMQSERLKEWLKNPPEIIVTRPHWIGDRSAGKELKRPEGFDPKRELERGSWGGGLAYEYEWYVQHNIIKREIDGGRRDLKKMAARLAAWVAPK